MAKLNDEERRVPDVSECGARSPPLSTAHGDVAPDARVRFWSVRARRLLRSGTAGAWARLERKEPGVAVATQRCWSYAEAMGTGSYSSLKELVTRDAIIALVISIVATAALVSLGVV
jgi:hypothetical protein